MSQESMLRLAKRGDETAIASVLNEILKDRGIQVVESTLNHGCLRIVLESREVPNRDSSVALLHEAIADLAIESAKSLIICAKQTGKYVPAWTETLALTNRVQDKNILNTKLTNSQGTISNKFQRWFAWLPTPTFISPEESENQQLKPQKLNKKLLVIGLIPLTAGGVYLWSKLPETKTANHSQEQNFTTSLTSVPQTDPFAYAVNKATSAANLTQSAKSKNEWKEVTSLWQEAIELMQAVPETNSNYTVAQEKVVDYQNNLEYAQSVAKKIN